MALIVNAYFTISSVNIAHKSLKKNYAYKRSRIILAYVRNAFLISMTLGISYAIGKKSCHQMNPYMEQKFECNQSKEVLSFGRRKTNSTGKKWLKLNPVTISYHWLSSAHIGSHQFTLVHIGTHLFLAVHIGSHRFKLIGSHRLKKKSLIHAFININPITS